MTDYVQGMEALIKSAFSNGFGHYVQDHVEEGHYDLMGPNGEIVPPQAWETSVEPGWRVTMYMHDLHVPSPPTVVVPISLHKRDTNKGGGNHSRGYNEDF